MAMVNYLYQIKNISNNKIYIGKTRDPKERWNKHLRMLRKGSHYNKYLQQSWDKYTEQSFIFEILKSNISDIDIDFEEIQMIALCKSRQDQYGYNLTEGGEGGKPCPEVIEKLRLAKLGKKRPHIGPAISKGKTGKKRPEFSQEWKDKISQANTGKQHSKEVRAKISEAKKAYWQAVREAKNGS